MKKWIPIFMILSTLLFGETAYQSAVEAYRNSDLSASSSYLDQALLEEPGNDRNHLLYGVVLQSVGDSEKAEEVMLKGLAISGPNRYEITYNLANFYLSQRRQEDAVELYSDLIGSSLEVKARLNRANCYLKLQSFPEAIVDYKRYLEMDSQSPQRENIEKILALLQQQVDLEKQLALEAAERAVAEEAARLEAERIAAEEAARQQALLDEILAALDSVGSDTEVISAGSESIETDTEESDIME